MLSSEPQQVPSVARSFLFTQYCKFWSRQVALQPLGTFETISSAVVVSVSGEVVVSVEGSEDGSVEGSLVVDGSEGVSVIGSPLVESTFVVVVVVVVVVL